MNSQQVKIRDNLLIGFIAQHRGVDNIISPKAICEFLGENGFHTKRDAIHQIVRKIILQQYLPICSANGKGYFWAESQTDIQSSIDDLQSRIDEMQNRIEILKKFIFTNERN